MNREGTIDLVPLEVILVTISISPVAKLNRLREEPDVTVVSEELRRPSLKKKLCIAFHTLRIQPYF